ncbi:MAG: hypothetical protein K2H72_03350, partial [Muribaculaceae bacterium]|nr:hypothetical protein [Muribaculaceae bacterium]
SVRVEAPVINSTNVSVNIPGALNVTIPTLTVNDVKIDGTDMADYVFKMQNVDKALVALKDIKTKNDIEIKVVLSVPASLASGDNSISFSDLQLQLPWGLMIAESNQYTYTRATGLLEVPVLPVGSDGKATLLIKAAGLELGDKGTVENGILDISGQVGVKSGKFNISVQNTVVPSNLDIRTDYQVSSFEIASFSGTIDYNMDNIEIDPISLNDLPDFLGSPQTNLVIANPQILVDFVNPVGKYGLVGKGAISLTSEFKNGAVNYESETFTLEGEKTKLAFCTPEKGYTPVKFDGLRNVLTNVTDPSGLPSAIKVNIHDISFSGDVTDFPLGNLGNAEGSYEFNAPLGFGNGSKVVYESTESGWASDDLDKVNITHVSLKANCSTNLPVSVKLEVFPIDKNGNLIEIDENSGNFYVPAKPKNEEVSQIKEVSLIISAKNGTTIKDFDGVKFVATVEQSSDNTEAIGPDLFIKLDKLSVTVAGYYDTDF